MAQIFQPMLLGPWMSMVGSRKMGSMVAKSNQKDLAYLKDLLQAGKIVPIIDRRYSFDDMQAAHAHVDTGRKKGNVVVTVSSDDCELLRIEKRTPEAGHSFLI